VEEYLSPNTGQNALDSADGQGTTGLSAHLSCRTIAGTRRSALEGKPIQIKKSLSRGVLAGRSRKSFASPCPVATTGEKQNRWSRLFWGVLVRGPLHERKRSWNYLTPTVRGGEFYNGGKGGNLAGPPG